MTSLECMALADRMDGLARQCSNKRDRDAYSSIAGVWRRSADYARQQEAWTLLLPSQTL